MGSHGLSLLIKLSTVKTLLCITSQAMNLVFGSVLDFQMTGVEKVHIAPQKLTFIGRGYIVLPIGSPLLRNGIFLIQL
jgi:hypothetical protein